MTETPKLNAMPMPGKSTVLKPQRVKLKYPRQRSTKIEGGWPRPPLNYCVLITLALCNSTSGSLTVQQIYQFTRYPLFSQLLAQNEGKRDDKECRSLQSSIGEPGMWQPGLAFWSQLCLWLKVPLRKLLPLFVHTYAQESREPAF